MEENCFHIWLIRNSRVSLKDMEKDTPNTCIRLWYSIDPGHSFKGHAPTTKSIIQIPLRVHCIVQIVYNPDRLRSTWNPCSVAAHTCQIPQKVHWDMITAPESATFTHKQEHLKKTIENTSILLHPASATGVIVLASSVCVCVSVSVCLSHSHSRTDRRTDLKFGMLVKWEDI